MDADPRQVTVVDAEDGLRMSPQLQPPEIRLLAGEDAAVPGMERARVRGPGQTTPQSR